MGTKGALAVGGLVQHTGGTFSALENGIGDWGAGGGTGTGSGVGGVEETSPKDLTSIGGVLYSGEGLAGYGGSCGEPTAEIGGFRQS